MRLTRQFRRYLARTFGPVTIYQELGILKDGNLETSGNNFQIFYYCGLTNLGDEWVLYPFVTEICNYPTGRWIHLSSKSQDLYPCENGVSKFSEFISRNSRVIEIYDQSVNLLIRLPKMRII